MIIITKIRNIVVYLINKGIYKFTSEFLYRTENFFYEKRLAVDTSGITQLSSLGISKNDCLDYMPLGYRAIGAALKKIPIQSSDIQFIDFGCGKGRAVIVAATKGYAWAAGIEMSETLCAVARQNIVNMRGRTSCKVEIINEDATTYVIPDKTNVIYFFNPFTGSVLERVVENIRNSYESKNRDIYIIFFNKVHFEAIVTGCDWIEKIEESMCYPDYSFGLYRING